MKHPTTATAITHASANSWRRRPSIPIYAPVRSVVAAHPHHAHRRAPPRPAVLVPSVDGVPPSILDHPRVLDDLATGDRPEAGHDVAAQAAAPDDDAENPAEGRI